MSAPNQDPAKSVLERRMRRKVPGATLTLQRLPDVPAITLALIDPDYPQSELSSDQVSALMDNPPYWAFCWASGQVLARHLLQYPAIVRDRTVIDLGCGSGVVAIAAAVAGAKRSIAVDIDQDALLATQFNARQNHIEVETCFALPEKLTDASDTLLLIADVFYDVDNLAMLDPLCRRFEHVWVADSRIEAEILQGLQAVAKRQSCTVPDLAEAGDFNHVTVYRATTSAP